MPLSQRELAAWGVKRLGLRYQDYFSAKNLRLFVLPEVRLREWRTLGDGICAQGL